MKKVLMAMAMVLMMVPGVMADTVTLTGTGGDHAGFGPFQSGSGGEFTMTPSDGLAFVLDTYIDGVTKNIVEGNAVLPNFQTFCLELGEGIAAYATYDATISDRAINGGVGPAGDPLSVGSAWLYHLFQIGELADYNYGYIPADPAIPPYQARKASALALQQAFWWLEDEIADPGAGNVFRDMVLTQFGSVAGAKANNNGQYDVRVLNLTIPGTRTRAQDVLVCIPTPVPEPGTLILLGIGLVGVAGFARKRFSK